MRERPILMTPENAQKCFDGAKTQTRRIMKPQPSWVREKVMYWQKLVGMVSAHKCPYGQAGDRLWVREAWQYSDWTEDGDPYICYRGDRSVRLVEAKTDVSNVWAELSSPENFSIDKKAADRKWRSPFHMFRWACRTVVEITEIRVERVQAISEEDARAEGCIPRPDAEIAARIVNDTPARMEFYALWASIHGPGSWERNPWVWVISFKKASL